MSRPERSEHHYGFPKCLNPEESQIAPRATQKLPTPSHESRSSRGPFRVANGIWLCAELAPIGLAKNTHLDILRIILKACMALYCGGLAIQHPCATTTSPYAKAWHISGSLGFAFDSCCHQGMTGHSFCVCSWSCIAVSVFN